jgi:hypothetical protein
MRRAYVAWERFLWRWESWFIHLHKSWRQAPAWNFVAIAGTAGIILTILLFLTPFNLATQLSARDQRIEEEKPAAWELDSRWDVAQARKQNAYPIELEFAPPEVVEQPAPRRRRAPILELDPPPKVEPRSTDWLAVETPPQKPERPKFDWDVEITCHRRLAEPDAPDVVLTARAESPSAASFDADFWNRGEVDEWKICRRPFEPAGLPHAGRHDNDHLTVAGELEDEPAGVPFEPVLIPESAPDSAEIALDVEWHPLGRNTSRRRRGPQLFVRNSGSQDIERIDVVIGSLAEHELPEIHAPSLQSWRQVSPGSEETLRVAQRRTPFETLSVVATAFVGSLTDVAVDETPVAEQPVREPIPLPEAPRPHLKLSTGTADKLRQHHMLRLPIQVLNDGNVDLDNVVIVARVPKSLSHRHGETVHYSVGRLRAGQVHNTIMLLTALETGAVDLPLSVADEENSAQDGLTANLEVLVDDVAETPQEETSTRRRRQKSAVKDF